MTLFLQIVIWGFVLAIGLTFLVMFCWLLEERHKAGHPKYVFNSVGIGKKWLKRSDQIIVKDLYAWKIFQITRSTKGDIRLAGYAQTGAKYSVLGENHYTDSNITTSPDAQMLQGNSLTSSGFHCFKKLKQCLEELDYKDSFRTLYHQRNYVVGKVRIWGTVVEASRGYQAEYLEIVELYTLDPVIRIPLIYDLYSILHRTQNAGWYRNWYHYVSGGTSIHHSDLADLLGWPFGEIKPIEEILPS